MRLAKDSKKDFYENWDTFMSDREPSGTGAPLTRQLRDIYSLRDHKQSVPVWLAISVRPEE